ncbi:hypothetical protein EMPS_04711 [Entomortierella parvispora]|uniref:Uncharacterized protein n=1 Tax=Entomortierella parvispora TaxID=205924 RepID=A0A9P3LVU3_9FUNG|nr:hypothetical protein EMPS_04711 [Entomortierella parvispora]
MPRIPMNVAKSLPRKLGPPPKSLPGNFQPTEADARSLYRSLRRVGSLSVMYTNPGHRIIRRKIREAFEESYRYPKTTPEEIKEQWERALNTKYMFEVASTRFGVEHSVISNLCTIAADRERGTTRNIRALKKDKSQEVDREYNALIQALNESMRISLR